jgi:phosphoribosylanthranilate isomerase
MNNVLKVKVCGMKFPQNIETLSALNPYMMGFIFHPNSPRYVERLDTKVLHSLPENILKIGVFVNQKFVDTYLMIQRYKLNGVQLHGNEPVEYCTSFKELGLKVLKSFPISDASDFSATMAYDGVCDYFVFDTKTTEYGGSGVKFDWNIITAYHGETPFFLSGGISMEDVETIKKIKHPKFEGVDINSKFEISPGLKSMVMVSKFVNELMS